MDKLKEIRMSLIIVIVGMFFLSGCLFNKSHTVTFKTNGGSEINNVTVKSGNIIEKPKNPKKSGYTFEGWYLNGKEYNFEDTVDGDITLVAKWKKNEEENVTAETVPDEYIEDIVTEEVTEEATTKKTTTAKVIVKTTKQVQTQKKTTTKKATTTKIGAVSNVSVTTTKKAEAVETPTQPVITPVTPENPEPATRPVQTQEMVLNVNKDNSNIIISFDTNKESNVSSFITEEDYKNIFNSSKSEWIIESVEGFTYDLNIDTNVTVQAIVLTGNENDVNELNIYTGSKHLVLTYISESNKWNLNYAKVTLGTGLNVKYYKDLVTAMKYVTDDNYNITLLNDIEVINEIVVKHPFTLNGENHEIKSTLDNLFILSRLNTENNIVLNDLKVNVNNLFDIDENSSFNKIILNNVDGSVKNITNDDSVVIKNNCNISEELR